MPKDKTNLAWKAAEKLRIKANITKGVEITIRKKIPIAAGLGGGSSNAASTLLGLKNLWGIDLPIDELIPLAAELGADVPFFLLNTNSAVGRGKGEKLDEIKILGSFFILLINPNIEISAAWAYQAFKAELTKKSRKLIIKNFNLDVSILDLILDADNDLEVAVIKKYSVISDIKKILTDSGALVAAMSGSGSTVFGLFDERAEALKCSEKVEHLGWSVFLTQTFSYSNLFI
jgi:4-diphosphocytidyl-2-C-methyl-D-erythritol kinase